jgi:RecA-family ATPase
MVAAMSPQELLEANGILLESTAPGRYYTVCPQCSRDRTGAAHQRAKVLGVTIEGDSVRWGCNHCGWSGPEKGINHQGNGHDRSSFAATYDYPDADGVLRFQKVRNLPGSKNRFFMRRPDGHCGWINNTEGVDTSLLYRIDEVNEAIANGYTILIVEGEKDVDNLWRIGIPATCNAHGASEPDKEPKWTIKHSEQLRGADIVVLNDNDAAGYAHADATSRLSFGIAKRVRRLDLALHWPNMPKGKDVSDWLAAGNTREQLDALIEQAPDYQGEDTPPPQPEPQPLCFINVAAWQDQKVPVREWVVPNRIPARNVTSLYGEGAVGKTILALQLSVAIVLGMDWLNTMPQAGPVLGVFCEDDTDELHRRLDLILHHYAGASYADLKDFHPLDMTNEDPLLAVPDRNGLIKPTPLFDRLHEAAFDIKPRLIVLDTAADVFGGDENDRTQVRQFIGILRRLAITAETSVLLTAHPSLTGIANRSGLSGSTMWNNGPRSRLYFKFVKSDNEDEEPTDPDLRQLEVMKANYGPVGETINLRWNNGLFLPVGGKDFLDKLAAEQKHEQMFLQLLTRFTSQRRNVSDKPTSNGYAPTVFAQEAEAKAAKISKAAFADAMRRLFNTNKIHNQTYGKASNEHSRLMPGPPPDHHHGRTSDE